MALLQTGLLGPQTLPLLLIAIGLGLSIAEAMAPGAHFIVIGVALLGAGLIGLVLGPLATPFVLALLVLVFGAITFYGYREFDVYGGKGQDQTSDSASLKGSLGRVTERVTRTGGQVKLNNGGFDPYYSARSMGDDIPVGEEVIVVDPGGGNVVTVASMGGDDDIDRALAEDRERRASGVDSGNDDVVDSHAEPEADTDAETDAGKETDADGDADNPGENSPDGDEREENPTASEGAEDDEREREST